MAESYISELGDKLSHGVENTDGSRVKIIAPKLYTDGDRHPSIATALAGKAASSHTHGNIQNGGTLQTTDVTIANGDKLVVTDASDSNKIARTSVSFDGSTTTKALTQKGTFESFAKSGDITTAIQALDVASVGGAGKYISAISETDGKISATATTMDTAPTASSTNAVTSGGIATALASKVQISGDNYYTNNTTNVVYYNFADIDCDRSYMDHPFNIKITGRNIPAMKLMVRILKSNSTTPGFSLGLMTCDPKRPLGYISSSNNDIRIGYTNEDINGVRRIHLWAQLYAYQNISWSLADADNVSYSYTITPRSIIQTSAPGSVSWLALDAAVIGTGGSSSVPVYVDAQGVVQECVIRPESLVYNTLWANGRDLTVYQVIGHSEMRGSAGRTTTLMISDGDIGRTQVTYIVTFLCRSSNSVTVTAIALQAISSGYFEFGYYIADGICYLVAQKSSWTSDARINVIDADPGFVLDPGSNTPMPTGYTKGTNLRNLAYEYSSDTTVIGNDSPASDCKTYFTNMPNGTTRTVYNDRGKEYTIVFSKAASGDYGSIIKYGYTDPYLYILRYKQTSWESSDWEKISAGTADSVSTAIGSGEIKLLGVANNVAGNYQPKMHPTIRAYYDNNSNGNILMIGPERGTRGAADRGGIRLSGGTGYYTQLQTADFTADRWHKLPDESGNLAITSGTYPNMSVGMADYASAAKSGSALEQAIAPDADVSMILYGDSNYSTVKALYNAGKKLYLVTGGSIQPSGRFECRIPLTQITYDANLEVNAFYFEQSQDDRNGASEVGSIASYRLDSSGWTMSAKQVGYAVNAGNANNYIGGGGIDTALQGKMATNGSNATNVAGGNIIRSLNDWSNPADAEMIAAASSSGQGKYTLIKLWDTYFKNKVNQIIPNVGYMGANAMTAMQKNGTDTMPGNNCKICLDPNTYYSFGYNGFTCLGHYRPTGSGQKYYGWCGNFAQNGGIVEIDFDYTATVEIARGSITSLPESMDVSFAAMTDNNDFKYGFALDASTIFATSQETMRFEVSGTTSKQIKGHAHLIGRGSASSTQTGTRIFVGAVQITSNDHFLVLNVNNIHIKVTGGQIYDVTYL